MRDTASTIQGFFDAENANDAEASAAFFTTDAEVRLPTGTLTTPEQIRVWQDGLAAGHFSANVPDREVSGNKATLHGTVGFDLFRNLGLPAVESTWEILVVDGKIKSFIYTFSPEAGARIAAAMAGHGD
jgi:hypothetical protein